MHGGGMPQGPAEEEAEGEDFGASFDTFMAAMKAGDTEGARAAFKAAVMACQDEYDGEAKAPQE
jgi:hypothetical protein